MTPELEKQMIKAAKKGDVAAVQRLLGIDKALVDARDKDGSTPLHCAAGTGDVRAIEILLAGGADRTLRTRIDDFETPADVASKAGHSEAAQVLMR